VAHAYGTTWRRSIRRCRGASDGSAEAGSARDDNGDDEAEPEPEPEPLPEPEPCRLRKRAGSGGASRGADKKTGGEIEQATAAATEPIKAFLDQVKRGFGDRFGASFAQEG